MRLISLLLGNILYSKNPIDYEIETIVSNLITLKDEEERGAIENLAEKKTNPILISQPATTKDNLNNFDQEDIFYVQPKGIFIRDDVFAYAYYIIINSNLVLES